MHSNYPDNWYDDSEDPSWVHIDTHEEALGLLQNKIDNAKLELVKLQWAIMSGDQKKIDEALMDAMDYLEG